MDYTALNFFQFIQKFYFWNESFSILENDSLNFFSQYYSLKRKSLEKQSIERNVVEFLDDLHFLLCVGVEVTIEPLSCDVARTLSNDFKGFWQCSELQQKEMLERLAHKLNGGLLNKDHCYVLHKHSDLYL